MAEYPKAGLGFGLLISKFRGEVIRGYYRWRVRMCESQSKSVDQV
jgi:hypothetical protein